MAKLDRHVCNELRDLRQRAGLSMHELAVKMGYKGQSSIQRYENEQQFSKDHLPIDIVRKLHKALVGLGEPPITSEEVMALAGTDIDLLLMRGASVGNDALVGDGPGINIETLVSSIQGVEEYLTKRRLTPSPAVKAKLIANVYELAQKRKMPDPDIIEQMLKMAS